MANLKELKPAQIKGPGDIIKRYLNSRGWNQEDLAEIINVSIKTISQLINHKQSISVEMAKILSKAFNNNPEFWLNLDNQYRLKLLNVKSKEDSASIKASIRKYIPVLEIQKNGWVQTSDKTAEGYRSTYSEIWDQDFTDDSVYEKDSQYAARQNRDDEEYTRYYSITWYKIALNRSCKITVPNYSPQKLEKVASNYSKYTMSETGIKDVIDALNQAGVKFLYQKHLVKTYLDGACFFDENNPVIVYTARYDRIDHFWFTLAHEIAHILIHFEELKSHYILDNLEDTDRSERENEADNFAGKILKYEDIVKLGRPFSRYFSERNLLAISNEVGVDPAVVLGKLQHDNIVDYRSRLNRYKRKIRDQF